jgi:hypothetical protein
MQIKALVIDPRGYIDIKENISSMEEIETMIGGKVKQIHFSLDEGVFVALMDKEAKLKLKFKNDEASYVVNQFQKNVNEFDLYGTVIFCSLDEHEELSNIIPVHEKLIMKMFFPTPKGWRLEDDFEKQKVVWTKTIVKDNPLHSSKKTIQEFNLSYYPSQDYEKGAYIKCLDEEFLKYVFIPQEIIPDLIKGLLDYYKLTIIRDGEN